MPVARNKAAAVGAPPQRRPAARHAAGDAGHGVDRRHLAPRPPLDRAAQRLVLILRRGGAEADGRHHGRLVCAAGAGSKVSQQRQVRDARVDGRHVICGGLVRPARPRRAVSASHCRLRLHCPCLLVRHGLHARNRRLHLLRGSRGGRRRRGYRRRHYPEHARCCFLGLVTANVAEAGAGAGALSRIVEHRRRPVLRIRRILRPRPLAHQRRQPVQGRHALRGREGAVVRARHGGVGGLQQLARAEQPSVLLGREREVVQAHAHAAIHGARRLRGGRRLQLLDLTRRGRRFPLRQASHSGGRRRCCADAARLLPPARVTATRAAGGARHATDAINRQPQPSKRHHGVQRPRGGAAARAAPRLAAFNLCQLRRRPIARVPLQCERRHRGRQPGHRRKLALVDRGVDKSATGSGRVRRVQRGAPADCVAEPLVVAVVDIASVAPPLLRLGHRLHHGRLQRASQPDPAQVISSKHIEQLLAEARARWRCRRRHRPRPAGASALASSSAATSSLDRA
mmetsp:Transcript_16193/g.56540  ORF Transcript_16193/g.56540 Transcript_16193/m.56540 type:complete len:513 (-) Transcript_16193:114-1652(-)